MYQILNVIYGVPLTPEMDEFSMEWDMDWHDVPGWNIEYHGSSSYQVAWAGVKLVELIDEGPQEFNIEMFDMTEAQFEEAAINVEAAKEGLLTYWKEYLEEDVGQDDINKLLSMIPSIGIWLVWSTS